MEFQRRRSLSCLLVVCCFLLLTAPPSQAANAAKTYVVLWFDTEDYLLPADDDASLRLADFLSREQIRATFKVVGEKARVLEQRGRQDVIAALKKHEIGYHSNFHSTQPSPAMYLSPLGWDEGVAEFDRREGPGRQDVQRIFGTPPTCYGQPGSSWGPQVFGAMKQWGMGIYLDAGSHVNLHDKPCYYGGALNLYKLAHILRVNINDPKDLQNAQAKFLAAQDKLRAEGGGIISIFYHPCEFVHKEFWDGVNFKNGANPPREQWRLPPAKTPEESRVSYQIFEDYIRFMKRSPDVQFITASEAARLYRDQARGRRFPPADLRAIAAAVEEGVTFQQHGDYALAASEVLALLSDYVSQASGGHNVASVQLKDTPFGPSSRVPLFSAAQSTDWSQFTRTTRDVADYLQKHGRVPTTVWLGSMPVPPEVYLRALAPVAVTLVDGKEMPQTIELRPAKLAVGAFVAEDGPELWGWVIFPRGFRAPAMMELARRQAWTLKPALLERGTE